MFDVSDCPDRRMLLGLRSAGPPWFSYCLALRRLRDDCTVEQFHDGLIEIMKAGRPSRSGSDTIKSRR